MNSTYNYSKTGLLIGRGGIIGIDTGTASASMLKQAFMQGAQAAEKSGSMKKSFNDTASSSVLQSAR